jgi:hypothetical protein
MIKPALSIGFAPEFSISSLPCDLEVTGSAAVELELIGPGLGPRCLSTTGDSRIVCFDSGLVGGEGLCAGDDSVVAFGVADKDLGDSVPFDLLEVRPKIAFAALFMSKRMIQHSSSL